MLKTTPAKNSFVLASQLREPFMSPSERRFISVQISSRWSLPRFDSEVNHRDINCKVAQSHDSELAGEARYGHELQAVGVVDRRALTNRQAGQQHNSSHWENGGGVH